MVDGGGSSDASAGSEGSTASGGSGGAGAPGTGGASGAGGSVATGGSDVGGSGGATGDGGSGGGSAGAGSLVTGRACTSYTDCGTGYDCYTMAPGGYCMPGGPGGPTGCRDPEQPCPEGTTCSPLPMHAISGVCMLTCATSADCRTGYICNYVELFRGDPGSPSSPNKVCWTACEPGVDQTCNDNPAISSLHGTCQDDGTCLCNSGFTPNPDTGRCY